MQKINYNYKYYELTYFQSTPKNYNTNNRYYLIFTTQKKNDPLV